MPWWKLWETRTMLYLQRQQQHCETFAMPLLMMWLWCQELLRWRLGQMWEEGQDVSGLEVLLHKFLRRSLGERRKWIVQSKVSIPLMLCFASCWQQLVANRRWVWLRLVGEYNGSRNENRKQKRMALADLWSAQEAIWAIEIIVCKWSDFVMN